MKRKYSKNSLGFTLIELILAISLLSFIILISTNFFVIGIKAHKITAKEYSMQSDIRIATEKTNEIVRYSKAVFAVPKSFVESTDVMDPGWNYIMVSSDSKRIVIMEYDEVLDEHIEKTIVEESQDFLYYIQFEKDGSAKSDSVIKYTIIAYNTDKNGNKTNEKLLFESSVETVNAIQVVDKGSVSSPSIALAFRSDGQTSGKGKNQIAYITIIVDISNSMNKTPSEGGSNDRETSSSRIYKVREALIGNGTSSGEGIIQMFSKEENVFISLVPFSDTANYPSPFANTKPTESHPIYEVYESNESTSLITTIKNMKADGHKSSMGGTNTGDGVRRAHHLHENFRLTMNNNGIAIKDKDQVHHYTILLIDGKSTFETNLRNWVDDGKYEKKNIGFLGWGGSYHLWVPKGNATDSKYFLGDGNVNLRVGSSSPYNGISVSRPVNGQYYGEKFDPISIPIIGGNGYETEPNISNIGSKYIESLGNLIKGFDSGNGVKSYIVGYASNLGTHINSIGTGIGTSSENIYKYDDSKFDLDEIFRNIATDIMADFWLAAGPQIIK